MISPAYRSQADLLIRILPHVANEKIFALKGGTAINLFERDMPRFSIDIDLTYVPLKERTEALGEIADGLRRIKQSLAVAIPGIQINESSPRDAEEIPHDTGSRFAVSPLCVDRIVTGTTHFDLARATSATYPTLST